MDSFGKQKIAQVGADLYRIRVKRRSLLDLFATRADVTVMPELAGTGFQLDSGQGCLGFNLACS